MHVRAIEGVYGANIRYLSLKVYDVVRANKDPNASRKGITNNTSVPSNSKKEINIGRYLEVGRPDSAKLVQHLS